MPLIFVNWRLRYVFIVKSAPYFKFRLPSKILKPERNVKTRARMCKYDVPSSRLWGHCHSRLTTLDGPPRRTAARPRSVRARCAVGCVNPWMSEGLLMKSERQPALGCLDAEVRNYVEIEVHAVSWSTTRRDREDNTVAPFFPSVTHDSAVVRTQQKQNIPSSQVHFFDFSDLWFPNACSWLRHFLGLFGNEEQFSWPINAFLYVQCILKNAVYEVPQKKLSQKA